MVESIAMTTPAEPTWATFIDTKVQSAVLTFLQETGWDIKRATFSTHCRTGRISKNRKGLYAKAVVKKYAEKNLVHNGLGTTVPENNENIATQKTLAEISRIKTAERRERFKFEVEQGKHIELGRVERELATRAVVLDQGLEFFFRAKVDEMVALVGGIADKAPLLLDLCLKEKDEHINKYARMDNFTIIIKDED